MQLSTTIAPHIHQISLARLRATTSNPAVIYQRPLANEYSSALTQHGTMCARSERSIGYS